MSTIDTLSYAELRELANGDKEITIGELKALTKELIQYVIKKREQAMRTANREAWTIEDDDDKVDLETPELSDDEVNELVVKL